MTKTYKIAAEPVPSPLQPTRWSFFVGDKRCGEAATRAEALRCARELVDDRLRDAAARSDGEQSVKQPRLKTIADSSREPSVLILPRQ
jgi:hypothetical protein